MGRNDDLILLALIEESIQRYELEKAFDELKKYVMPFDEEYVELTVLMARYNSLKKKRNLGLIGYLDNLDACIQEENRIIYALTTLIRKVKEMLIFERPESDYCLSNSNKSELVDILKDNRKSIIDVINKLSMPNEQECISEFDQIHLNIIEAVEQGKIIRMYNLLKKMYIFLTRFDIDINMYNVGSVLFFKILNDKIEVGICQSNQTGLGFNAHFCAIGNNIDSWP